MQQLTRGIGRWGASFLVLNGLIGAGIFALPQKLLDQLGGASVYLFLIFGLLMLSIVYCFAKLAERFPHTGGPVEYAAHSFGPLVTFQTAWLYYLARVTALAANVHVALLYGRSLFPALNETVPQTLFIIGCIGLLTWINWVGVRRVMQAIDSFTALKMLPLIALTAAALYVGLSAALPNLSTAIPAGFDDASSQLGGAALLTLYAFIGFETVVVTSGETHKPKKTVPFALLATLCFVALLYALIQWAYWLHSAQLDSAHAPLVALAAYLWGESGIIIMTLTVVFSVFANLLASALSASRLSYALAEKGQLPASMARLHPDHATPTVSIMFLGGLATVLCLTGSFTVLAVASVLARLLVYMVCIVTLLRVQNENTTVKTLLTARVGKAIVPIIAFAVCVWSLSHSGTKAWLTLAAECAVGLLLYWWFNRRTKTPSTP